MSAVPVAVQGTSRHSFSGPSPPARRSNGSVDSTPNDRAARLMRELEASSGRLLNASSKLEAATSSGSKEVVDKQRQVCLNQWVFFLLGLRSASELSRSEVVLAETSVR